MITIQEATKRYGSFVAVDRVSLQIDKGAFLALLGPNGAGKTTLVRLLLGFSKPTAGRLTINHHRAGMAASRAEVGFLPENHRIPPNLSGRTYLMRHAALMGLGRAAAGGEISRVLDVVGMQGKEKNRAGTYSKGMTQRMGLAAALLGNPDVLILDEPTSGLDPMGIRDFRLILERLAKKDVTVVLNSHLLSEVEKTCDRVAIMHRGRIRKTGTVDTVVGAYQSLEDVFVNIIEATNG